MPSRPPTDCQLLVDPPADGAWNMAVDEMLLNAASELDVPTLRFYQWQRPTLSLGYFQSYAERWSHLPSKEIDVVRRLSGGGAIVHDQELTYSLILPASHRLSRDTQTLYNVVHQTILEVLHTFFTPKPVLCERTVAAADEPFLCFQRRALGDILLNETGLRAGAESRSVTHKIVGSAQRRRGGTVLQHGSILLDRSPAAPELDGIATLTGRQLSATTLLARLPDSLGKALGLKLSEFRMNHELSKRAKQWQENRFANRDWTERR